MVKQNKHITQVKQEIKKSVEFIDKEEFDTFKDKLKYNSFRQTHFKGWITGLMYSNSITRTDFLKLCDYNREMFDIERFIELD